MKEHLISKVRSIRNQLFLRFSVRNNVIYGNGLHVGPGSVVDSPNHLEIGDSVYIGKNCTIECDGSIGNHVLIANLVGLIGRYDHDYTAIGTPIRNSPWIGESTYKGKGQNLKIVIEDDVWIGYGSIVLSGVKVSRGSIIAAGSIVTRDIPPYAIVAGSPAVVKSYRFTPAQIEQHEKILYSD